ncbi:hypothetical protein Tco_1532091 [Tanacetum coccineum]
MGTTRGIIDEGTEGPISLGPERPRVYSELSQDEKDRCCWLGRAQKESGECTIWVMLDSSENGVVLDDEQLLFLAGGKDNDFNGR